MNNFNQRKRTIICVMFVGLLSVIATVQAFSQGITVTGTVTDNSGDPLLGVNVVIKGTTTGVITLENGNYSLNVPNANSVLQFSYIGFVTQEIQVGTKRVVNVRLIEDTQLIDELIVVGYGTMRKSDITGAVTSVNSEEMLKRNPINIVQGLQGAAAGVLVSKNSGSPDGSATVLIRGVATITASASPLYVVDGIQVGTNANFVNPADIERMEVLKDASSTAIYGARGANGVILITTKRGDRGRTRLNFSSNVGIQQLSGRLDVADADLFAYALREGRKNDGSVLTNKAFSEDYIGKLRTIDWQDAMTRQALQQNYTLSASGGNDNTQANLSLGYLNNEGIVINSDFTRLTVRANITQKVKDFIEMGGSVTFVHSENRGSGNLRNWATLTPTMDYVDPVTGEFISHNYNDRTPNGKNWYTFMQITASAGDLGRSQDNPYAASMWADQTPTYSNRVLANANLDIKLFKGLSFKTIASYSLSTSDGSTFSRANNERIPTANNYNTFSMSQSQGNDLQLENYFTYAWKNAMNNLTLTAGNNISRSWGHRVNASGREFPSDTYRDFSLTTNVTARDGGGRFDLESRFVSFFGRMLYSFNDRYSFTATVRRDGSSNFGAGKRWGTFPSAAVAWRLSEEDFIKNLGYFKNLKLRLSWGQTGNSGGATNLAVPQLSNNRIAYNYSALNGLNAAGANTKEVGFAQLNLIDENLHWEVNTQTNLGLDFGILNNELNVALDYFIRDAKDLLINYKVRPSTGFVQVRTNAGHIRNSGFELTLDYNKRINREWNFGIKLTGSTLKNSVIEVGDPIFANNSDSGDQWNDHSITMNGYAVGSFYGYRVEGIFRDQAEVDKYNDIAKSKGLSAYQVSTTAPGDFRYKDKDNSGNITASDKEVLGNGFPTINYGLNVTAGYKNFDAMIYSYGVAGVDIFSYSKMKMTNLFRTGGGVQNPLKYYINNAWTENNRDASMSRMTIVDRNQNYRVSDAYIVKGDYFKLANLQIGYTFPRSILTPVKMETARFYFSIENIACFSSYNKYGDPEVGTGSVLLTGFDPGRYPYPRTYTVGLNFSF